MSVYPIHLGTHHIFGQPLYGQRVFNRVFILLYIKCFPTLEAVMDLSDLGVSICPYVHMPPVCLDSPICLDAPLFLDAPYTFGDI